MFVPRSPSVLVRTTPPGEGPVTLDEAKAFCRIDGDDEDLVVSGLIEAATARLDGAGGLLRRCLVSQVWDLRLDTFPIEVVLPLPPVQEVLGISYTAPDGTPATIAGEAVNVYGLGTNLASVLPPIGADWPDHQAGREAVRVSFRTGSPSPTDIPAPLRTALLMAVAAMFENRQGSSDPFAGAMPLLAPFRKPVFA